ncbi:hypothetical protein D3C81_2301780 [compost metagenome]
MVKKRPVIGDGSSRIGFGEPVFPEIDLLRCRVRGQISLAAAELMEVRHVRCAGDRP